MPPTVATLRPSRGTARRPPRLAAVAAVVGAVVVSALLAACSGGGAGNLLGGGDGTSTGVVKVAPADRKAPPTVAGTTLDGEQLDLADLRGDVVVLNIWGSWCGPCRAESPALEATAKAFEPDGVRFVGLDTKDSDAQARAFVRSVGMTYPSIVDPDGEVQLSLRDHVPPTGVPSTIVLDRDGRVAVTVVGAVTQASLTDVLQPVVDEHVRVRGRTLDGGRVDTADLDGTAVAVHVWGSWCAPCRDDVDAVRASVAGLADTGVDVALVGVATDDRRRPARALATRSGVADVSVLDPDGELVDRLARAAHARGLTLAEGAVPAVVVLDRSGAVADVLPGPLDDGALTAALRAAAGEA